MRDERLISEERVQDYLKRLVDREGIQRLGTGAFSHVFQHPYYKNVVVKVYLDRDRAYAKYLQWCRKHQSNPYVPQIIDVVPQRSGSQKYNIAFMQKMRKINGHRSYVKALRKAFGIKPEDQIGDTLFDDLEGSIAVDDQPAIHRQMEALLKAGYGDANLRAALGWILGEFPVSATDLHDGNCMLRGSQLVITDPVAYDEDYDPNKRLDDQA